MCSWPIRLFPYISYSCIAILNHSLILLLLTHMISELTNLFFLQSTKTIKTMITVSSCLNVICISFATISSQLYSFWWFISECCIYSSKTFKYKLLISLECITFQSNEKHFFEDYEQLKYKIKIGKILKITDSYDCNLIIIIF